MLQLEIGELAANSDFWAILWQNKVSSGKEKETKCLGNCFVLLTDLKTINLPTVTNKSRKTHFSPLDRPDSE